MVKICVDLEDIEAYEELKRYLKSKSGKYRGLLGNEIAKAIKLYVQQLKASEGTPQSPQPKLPTEKAKESKPIEHRETAKDLEQKVEGLTKRIEDLEKELKATEETVKSLTKNITDISNKIDEYVKQRLEQALKITIPKITKTIENSISEHCFMICGSTEERRASLEELLRPSFKELENKVKQEVKNEVLKELSKQEEKKGGLFD